MSGEFELPLDWREQARMYVRWRTNGREIVNYAVTLIAVDAGEARTVRVYDGAHGVNEMHRYTRVHGKQPATIVHDGTLGEGFRAAQLEVRQHWADMIEGWRR